jgi:Uncharacterised ACR, YggU family COG1872
MPSRPPETLVRVRVQPRASRDEILDWQDEALRVRVTAPPVEGEANTAGLSLADVRARLAAAVTAAVLVAGTFTGIAAAEHLSLEPTARPLAPRPFDGNFSVRMDGGTFHIGGRLFGFGQSLGAWLRGSLREGGVTLDGQLQGDRTYNFRLDADGARPSLKIEISPGAI